MPRCGSAENVITSDSDGLCSRSCSGRGSAAPSRVAVMKPLHARRQHRGAQPRTVGSAAARPATCAGASGGLTTTVVLDDAGISAAVAGSRGMARAHRAGARRRSGVFGFRGIGERTLGGAAGGDRIGAGRLKRRRRRPAAADSRRPRPRRANSRGCRTGCSAGSDAVTKVCSARASASAAAATATGCRPRRRQRHDALGRRPAWAGSGWRPPMGARARLGARRAPAARSSRPHPWPSRTAWRAGCAWAVSADALVAGGDHAGLARGFKRGRRTALPPRRSTSASASA